MFVMLLIKPMCQIHNWGEREKPSSPSQWWPCWFPGWYLTTWHSVLSWPTSPGVMGNGKYLAPSHPTVSSPMSNTVYHSDAGFQFSHNYADKSIVITTQLEVATTRLHSIEFPTSLPASWNYQLSFGTVSSLSCWAPVWLAKLTF